MPHEPQNREGNSPIESLTKTIRGTLQAIDDATGRKYKLFSEAAVELLLGTALKESGGLRWRVQLSGGPARGLFQMERATYDDIWTNYLAFRPPLSDAIKLACTPAGGALSFDQITQDDAYAALMARLKYLRVPAALPPAGDLQAQAQYWKTYYNTNLGKGTAAGYVTTWKTYAVGGGAVCIFLLSWTHAVESQEPIVQSQTERRAVSFDIVTLVSLGGSVFQLSTFNFQRHESGLELTAPVTPHEKLVRAVGSEGAAPQPDAVGFALAGDFESSAPVSLVFVGTAEPLNLLSGDVEGVRTFAKVIAVGRP